MMKSKEKLEGKFKAPHLKLAHWAVLLASVLLTLGAWNGAQYQRDQRINDQFLRESQQLVNLVSERMEKYADSLWAGVATIYAKDYDITYNEWKNFASNLDLAKKYPGINGIGVIYRIESGELDAFLKEQRKNRPDFSIHPFQNKEEYWPITYIEPEKGNWEAIGLDISHENNRYKAALAAKRTGDARITGPITLVQDKIGTPGFLFYAPFYLDGEPGGAKTKEERFLGHVYAPFIVSKLIYGTLEKERRFIGVEISDAGEVLYSEHSPHFQEFDPEALYARTVEMEFYGRTWEFDLRSTKAFEDAADSNQPLMILLAGIIIDILLFIVFYNMNRANAQARLLAKKMSEEAEVQRSAAIHASKLAALGEMAGGIAHEINNPLSVILNYASFIQGTKHSADSESSEIVAQAADKIEEAVKRITSIVDGLRAFSREGSKDNFEIEDVHDILLDALEFAKEQFRNKGVALRRYSTPGLYVECQKVQISQVLINLINNARFAAEKSKEKWVKIAAERSSDGTIKIKVCNSGAPIKPEVREKLFQPFFTTKEAGEGTGLGLSISKGIIEAHEGRLYYDPSFERTTFIIELPAKVSKSS